MNCFYLENVYNLEAVNHITKYNSHFEEFIKKLADLDRKMQEIDELSIGLRSAINEIFWGIRDSIKKEKV